MKRFKFVQIKSMGSVVQVCSDLGGLESEQTRTRGHVWPHSRGLYFYIVINMYREIILKKIFS